MTGDRLFQYMLWAQVATFVAAGLWFLWHDNWRLGVAQLLLAGVQAVIYVGV